MTDTIDPIIPLDWQRAGHHKADGMTLESMYERGVIDLADMSKAHLNRLIKRLAHWCNVDRDAYAARWLGGPARGRKYVDSKRALLAKVEAERASR